MEELRRQAFVRAFLLAVDAYKNATGTKGFANPTYNAAASTTEGIQALIFGE